MQPGRIRTDRAAAAAVDYRYLLSHDYSARSALEFVGNHFQLRREERDFLFRAVCSFEKAVSRHKKVVPVEELAGSRLIIDGYNCLITIENALKGRPLILGDDGFVRDVARVFRKYRPTELTRDAWSLIAGVLAVFQPDFVLVFLDSRMSGSGKLASRINFWLRSGGMNGRCVTVRCSEKKLASLKGIIASADSVIVDRAERVFDLAGYIVMHKLRIKLLRLPVDEMHGFS